MIKTADWIWADCEYSYNQYVDFYLDFDIDAVDENAYIQISVDSEYVLRLNGAFVNCGQYHDFPAQKVYDTLYVGDKLTTGKNRLEISAYHQGGKSMQYSAGVNALCFALVNNGSVYTSGTGVMASVNRRYTQGDIYQITGQLGYGYMYDAGAEVEAFSPAVVKKVDTNLVPRPTKKNDIRPSIPTSIVAQGYFIREDKDCDNSAHRLYTDFLSHRIFEDMFEGESTLPGKVVLREMKHDGVYMIIDLGREESGFFTMDICADKGALVEIGFGEHLRDLRVRTEIMSRRFVNTYIASGNDDSFTYYFKRIAGRYIQIHISGTTRLEINYIGIKPCYYPITEKGSFVCNDSLHNKIYQVSLNTLRQCMHEHYEDCPWREQSLYASDSRNQILCGYYIYEDYDFIRSSLTLLGDSFAEDGFQSICAPTDYTLRIPSFTFLWFAEIADYTRFTDDSYFVDKYWDTIEKVFEIYSSNNFCPDESEDYWNFYEWSEGYDGVKKKFDRASYDDLYDGMYKVFVCFALTNLLYLADKYNKTDFAEKYRPVYESISAEVNERLWDEDRGVYSSYYYDGKKQHYGELMQAMAVWSGVARGKEDRLCDVIADPDNGLVKITLSYSLYKYEMLLCRDGRYDEFVFEEIGKKWGNMLFEGSTSFWETEIGADDFVRAGSLCHGWSAFPVYLYYRYVMGISPEMLRGEGKPERRADVFASFEGHSGNVRVVKREGEQCDYIK